jgi:predicted ATP-dependent endonuclease of OLD family
LKISTFKVDNYRSLKQITLDNLGNLNILIGKNSSGKSNILEAMNMFFSEFEPVKGTTVGLDEYLWNKESNNKPIVFEVTIDLTGDQLMGLSAEDQAFLNASFGKALPPTLKITRSLLNVQGVWKTNSIIWGPLTLVKDDLPQITPAPRFEPAGMDRVLRILSAIMKDKFRLVGTNRDVKGGDRFRTTILDESVQSRLWNIQQSTSPRDEEKYSNLESAFSDVTSFRLDSAQARQMVKKGNKRFPLGLEGGGIQGTTNLLFTALIETDSSIIMGIEEPENHGHPELQRKLSKVIQKLAHDRQIFITTHSPVFLNTTQDGTTWMVTVQDGQTEITPADDFERILREVGSMPGDVLFSNRVILVEGKSDKIILEAFARKLGIDLSDVSIIPIRGKTNAARALDATVPAANEVIPIFLILDADANAETAQLIEKKTIQKDQVHIWKAGSIESYYPHDTLRDALQAISNRYSLNLNVNKFMQEIQQGKLRPDKIDIGDKVKQLDSSWEMTLAEEVAKGLDHSQSEPSTEVRDTLIAATATSD